jgi:hypothetical protein
MTFRFTVSKLTILFSAGALVAVGCGGGGPGGAPSSLSGQDPYAANTSSKSNSTLPGTISPVDNYGALGPGNDLSPNVGTSGPDTSIPDTSQGAGGGNTQGGGGSTQGGGGKTQGGGGKTQGGGGKTQGGGGTSGVDCNSICSCPQFADSQAQCQAACAAPSAACLGCVTAAKGDCAKIFDCGSVCTANTQGGGGTNTQGGGGSPQGGGGSPQGGGGTQSGASCADLGACCPSLDASLQMPCSQESEAGNESKCASDLQQLQSAGLCTN